MTAKKHDAFILFALAYLGLPNILFLLGWITPSIGVPVTGALVLAIFCASTSDEQSARRALSRGAILAIAASTFLWPILCGVGGLTPQSSDYIKHSVIFHDLI